MWVDIELFEELYQVNDLGQVRGKRRNKIKKSYINNRGWETFTLSFKGKLSTHYAHRLVMTAFHGYSEHTIKHIDGNKSNNRLDNLKYEIAQPYEIAKWATI